MYKFTNSLSYFCSVCIHPSVLKDADNSDIGDEELDNIVKLIFKFLHQVHPGLKLNDKDYKFVFSKASELQWIQFGI